MLDNCGSLEQVLQLHEAGQPSLSIRRLPASGPALLYVHGATFPAALSINYRIDGLSWADDLHARGFDVWSFDLPGYGDSDWPHCGATIADQSTPGRACEAARHVARTASFILKKTGRPRLSVIAHSWGTIPAGLFAGTNPQMLDKLVLFGPAAERDHGSDAPAAPFTDVTVDQQWAAFNWGIPHGEISIFPRDRFDAWAEAWLATDGERMSRTPVSVRIPSGPDADFADAWSGRFLYDPGKIEAPTLIVRGEWDLLTTDLDAAWLVERLAAVPGGAADIKLPRGAHRMHLEENRQLLFDAVGYFLTRSGQ